VRKIFLVCVLALCANHGMASDIRVAVYAVTHHVSPGNYREHHPMLQVEYQQRLIGGVFLNSASRWSAYAGYRVMDPWWNRAYLEIGTVSGYAPGLIRSVRFGTELNKHMDLVIMPGFVDHYSWQITRPISVVATIIKF